MLGALVLLGAPGVGAFVRWALWQTSQFLAPSTTTVIVEAPRPTPTSFPASLPPPTAMPVQPGAVPAAATGPAAVATSAPIVTPVVAGVPGAGASPSPAGAVAAAPAPSPAGSPAPGDAGLPVVASPAPVGPTAVIAAAPVPTDIVHVVEAGETIARIALRYGVPPETILRANGLTDRTRTLRIGDRLIVPGVTATPVVTGPLPRAAAPTRTPTPTTVPVEEGVHIAEAGDTLSGIAERYGVSLEALLQANGFDDPDRVLRVGERITIPDEADPATPDPTSAP